MYFGYIKAKQHIFRLCSVYTPFCLTSPLKLKIPQSNFSLNSVNRLSKHLFCRWINGFVYKSILEAHFYFKMHSGSTVIIYMQDFQVDEMNASSSLSKWIDLSPILFRSRRLLSISLSDKPSRLNISVIYSPNHKPSVVSLSSTKSNPHRYLPFPILMEPQLQL